mgnify:CR=1 FL=1
MCGATRSLSSSKQLQCRSGPKPVHQCRRRLERPPLSDTLFCSMTLPCRHKTLCTHCAARVATGARHRGLPSIA